MSGRFEVDRKGLAATVARKGFSWVLHELLQNAWDEDGVTTVSARIRAVEGRPEAIITVEDDAPEGFRDLSHAYTLFADSYKKSDPTKRGRWNLGDKFVIAMALSAQICTTKGTVTFEGDRRNVTTRKRLASGSLITIRLKMTHADCDEVVRSAGFVLVPDGIRTTFNDELLVPRIPLCSFSVALPTEIGGVGEPLRRTIRQTTVTIYEPKEGEIPTLFERGIPVVELGDRYHVDVAQKVPLGIERDNVPPTYLRQIRTEVLNAMHASMSVEDFAKPWVATAISDERVGKDALGATLDARFGHQRVVFDPSDPDANRRAASAGFTVVTGSMLPKETWQLVKDAGLLPPAGHLFPTRLESLRKVVPESEWTAGMKWVASYTRALGRELLNKELKVEIVDEPKQHIRACFGGDEITYNVGLLGELWFKCGATDEVNRLIIHEFGHNAEADHLSSRYYEALCMLGARLARLALEKPEIFQQQ